jgi:hypothetical protein
MELLLASPHHAVGRTHQVSINRRGRKVAVTVLKTTTNLTSVAEVGLEATKYIGTTVVGPEREATVDPTQDPAAGPLRIHLGVIRWTLTVNTGTKTTNP